VFGVIVIAIVLAACGSAASQPTTTAPPLASAVPASAAGSQAGATAPLTVYGAASMSGALSRLKAAWEAANPGSTLTISTDSSAALETQIEQGAPADVFLSADTTNPKKLADASLADGPAVAFAGNLLTIVVPAGNPAHITVPSDLGRPGVKIIAAGDDVPISKYARQVVANLAKAPSAPTGFEAAYSANVISKEDNVKAVIAKIELGEGDAGIVYGTDAKASTKVSTIAIPGDANVPATYAGVVVKASAHTADAHAFLSWVAGPDGRAILGAFGFLPPAD
jgi:molybdate transport system substrate-binding protein